VFGIGLHKTGTTSLGVALEGLGYTVCHGAISLRVALGHRRMMHLLRCHELEPIMRVAEHYDAFEDNPWFLLYRELDARFAHAKFILTMRDESRWLESALRYYDRTETDIRRSDLRHWIYGVRSPVGHEQRWLERYRQHNDDVKAYFRNRPGDLLVVDWERGSGWAELASFLGRDVPSRSFPHENRGRPAGQSEHHAPAPSASLRPYTQVDLRGSVLVLTHPRTGSSLVMQTLRLLGADVIGDALRADLPESGNPKGYFEDRDLLRHGLHAPALAERPDLVRGRAVKLALSPLVRRRSREEWTALSQPGVALVLPIRTPVETLLSQERLLRAKQPDAPPSILFRSFARSYLEDLACLADQISSPGFTGRAPICIDYRQAMDDPAGYVGSVASAAGLRPSPAQVAEALLNIARSLYRCRADEGDEVRQLASGLRPLQAIHDALRRNDPGKWERLHRQLPPWASGADVSQARVERNRVFVRGVDSAHVSEYQTWERLVRDEMAERRHVLPSRVAFEIRASDMPQKDASFRLMRDGDRTVVVNARTRRPAATDYDQGLVELIIDAIDGTSPYGEILERVPPSRRTAFTSVCRGLLGSAITLAPAVERLQRRVPLAELVRFPQQSPYSVSRAYWENSIAIRESLPLLFRSAAAFTDFADALRGFHRIATLGESGRNYYGGASGLPTAPGEFRQTSVRTFVSTPFLRTIEKWLVPLRVPGRLQYEGVTLAPSGHPLIERRAAGRVCLHPAPEGTASIRALLEPARHELLRALEALEGGDTEALVTACARFHQQMVSVHPFTNVNNSIAMNVVNGVLMRRACVALPHLFLDYLALRLTPADYVVAFHAAVRDWSIDYTRAGSTRESLDRTVPLLRIAMMEHWIDFRQRHPRSRREGRADHSAAADGVA
jgi:hypothetical protein